VVVVTGASSGIGRATAVACARRGDRVVLAARSPRGLRAAERECVAAGATATLVVPTDVLDEAAVAGLARAAVDRFGRIDVWVECAAVMAYGRFLDVPTEVFRRVVETNVFGTAHAARAALPVFVRQGGGVLVVVSSLLGEITAPYMSAYVTSKWALRGLAGVLRQELREAPGVRVCLVHPAAVNTPIYLQAANYAGREGRPPLPAAAPERVARVILRCAERPRRQARVGPAYRGVSLAFHLTPGLFDALVGPVMRRAALSRRPSPATAGNVFAPRPDGDAPRGRWDDHRLRATAAGLAAAGTVAAAVLLRCRR
jgi:NAD(P)-dependent dehydrogenase (short-subunit alcohol dehydrogenase family)